MKRRPRNTARKTFLVSSRLLFSRESVTATEEIGLPIFKSFGPPRIL